MGGRDASQHGSKSDHDIRPRLAQAAAASAGVYGGPGFGPGSLAEGMAPSVSRIKRHSSQWVGGACSSKKGAGGQSRRAGIAHAKPPRPGCGMGEPTGHRDSRRPRGWTHVAALGSKHFAPTLPFSTTTGRLGGLQVRHPPRADATPFWGEARDGRGGLVAEALLPLPAPCHSLGWVSG